MKISIHVKPGAKQNRLEKMPDGQYRVWVKAPPTEGRANRAMIEMLSEYFGKPKASFSIIVGAGSKRKVVEVRE